MKHDLDNEHTRMPTADDVHASLPDAVSLYARVAAYLPASPRHGSNPGYRIFWSEKNALRFRDVLDHPRSFAVLGRHSRAHIRLLGDSTLALRHFVFRAKRSDAGVPELHVADVLAPLPLLIDGSDEAQHACVIEGAFSARIGAHAIAAFPFDGCGDLDARGGPAGGDRPESDDHEGIANKDDLPFDAVAGPAEYVAAKGVDDECSGDWASERSFRPSISEPAPVVESTQEYTITMRPVPRTTHVELLAREPPPNAAVMLEICGALGRRSISLSEDQLRGMVIVGRYSRCVEGGEVFSSRVSRMHCALARTPRGVEVLDLASTHGISVDGEVVRHHVVEGSATLVLTKEDRVYIRVTG